MHPGQQHLIGFSESGRCKLFCLKAAQAFVHSFCKDFLLLEQLHGFYCLLISDCVYRSLSVSYRVEVGIRCIPWNAGASAFEMDVGSPAPSSPPKDEMQDKASRAAPPSCSSPAVAGQEHQNHAHLTGVTIAKSLRFFLSLPGMGLTLSQRWGSSLVVSVVPRGTQRCHAPYEPSSPSWPSSGSWLPRTGQQARFRAAGESGSLCCRSDTGFLLLEEGLGCHPDSGNTCNGDPACF